MDPLFYAALVSAAGEENVYADEPMSRHTTFRIGGPADYFVNVSSGEVLKAGMAVCREYGVPFMTMGNGSNMLVGDKGYRGVIFDVFRMMSGADLRCEGEELIVTAECGILLSALAKEVSGMGYTGFEFATGIPGTLGGAAAMNAGAYGGEISDCILWAEVMDREGNEFLLDKETLELGYRKSRILAGQYTALRACFSFKKGDPEAINSRVAEITAARREKQPLEYPSAGSTFKRPEGYFAGKLIEDCGLKGESVGGAMVSPKHGGFIINTGGASAKDVLDLIRLVQDRVKEMTGVSLEPEVRLVGEF
ncbi:MAG: UDP-N-acetylmuramate dehydrogenase [Lachnospiraceae bacterium]|nr:UDP-N-acetylmuramate dehydrogenase [Lachnospiraceae bacterium]